MQNEDPREHAEDKDEPKKRKVTKFSSSDRTIVLAKTSPTTRYQKLFFGYYYSFNNFGHKALDCRAKLDIRNNTKMIVQ